MLVSEVNITPIKPNDGLVAFASCVLNDELYVGSMGVHKLIDGTGYRITYPTKKIGSRQLNFFHPVNKKAGVAIESAVIAKCVEIFKRSDERNDRYNKTSHRHP